MTLSMRDITQVLYILLPNNYLTLIDWDFGETVWFLDPQLPMFPSASPYFIIYQVSKKTKETKKKLETSIIFCFINLLFAVKLNKSNFNRSELLPGDSWISCFHEMRSRPMRRKKTSTLAFGITNILVDKFLHFLMHFPRDKLG